MSSTLEIATPGDRDLVLTRVFNAPRQLVFDAMTRPELLRQWYGPVGWTMVVCEVDLRVGGSWRFVSHRPDGKEIGQHGVYQDVTAPERLVNTESWEDWNPGEVLVTTVLTEVDDRTTFSCTIRFPTAEVRTMLIKAGMTSGAEAAYDKLAALLGEG